MTINVDVEEAAAHFSDLFQRVLLGEEIVISEGGNAVAQLVPVLDATSPRVPGQDKGKIFIAPDFDEPL
jgi:antitoxin (DNA-binding transcriptional repressor) of toxin-antitoxin stability system